MYSIIQARPSNISNIRKCPHVAPGQYNSLPVSILAHILSHVGDIIDIAKCSRVSSGWREALSEVECIHININIYQNDMMLRFVARHLKNASSIAIKWDHERYDVDARNVNQFLSLCDNMKHFSVDYSWDPYSWAIIRSYHCAKLHLPLQDAESLETLVLQRFPIHERLDHARSILGNKRFLKKLVLSGCFFEDEVKGNELAALIGKIYTLETLAFDCCRFSSINADLLLSGLRSLVSLRIRNADDASLAAISKHCPNLRKLVMWTGGSHVTLTGMLTVLLACPIEILYMDEFSYTIGTCRYQFIYDLEKICHASKTLRELIVRRRWVGHDDDLEEMLRNFMIAIAEASEGRIKLNMFTLA